MLWRHVFLPGHWWHNSMWQKSSSPAALQQCEHLNCFTSRLSSKAPVFTDTPLPDVASLSGLLSLNFSRPVCSFLSFALAVTALSLFDHVYVANLRCLSWCGTILVCSP